MINLYSIYDKKTKCYSSVFMFPTHEIAYRKLKSEIFKTCSENPFFKEEDFEVVHIGYMNTEEVENELSISPIDPCLKILDSAFYISKFEKNLADYNIKYKEKKGYK